MQSVVARANNIGNVISFYTNSEILNSPILNSIQKITVTETMTNEPTQFYQFKLESSEQELQGILSCVTWEQAWGFFWTLRDPYPYFLRFNLINPNGYNQIN